MGLHSQEDDGDAWQGESSPWNAAETLEQRLIREAFEMECALQLLLKGLVESHGQQRLTAFVPRGRNPEPRW